MRTLAYTLFYYQDVPTETTLIFIFPRNKISEAAQISVQRIIRERLFAKTDI
jgi:hypothetical protein